MPVENSLVEWVCKKTQVVPYLPIYILPILLTLLVFQLRLKKIWTILLLIPVGGIAFLTYPFPLLPLMFAYGHYFYGPLCLAHGHQPD